MKFNRLFAETGLSLARFAALVEVDEATLLQKLPLALQGGHALFPRRRETRPQLAAVKNGWPKP